MDGSRDGSPSLAVQAYNFTLGNLTAVEDWGDLLVGPFNQTESEEWRREYIRQFHVRHRNDPEVKYAVLIFYMVMFTMIGSQSALVYWKKTHKRSYELVTLLGLWLVPAVASFYFHFWYFLAVWAAFSGVTLYLMYLCSQKRMASSTPRKVYSWFLGIFKLSIAIGVGGYGMLLLELLGIGTLLRPILSPTFSIMMLWYGLYFGVLGRDCAEVVSDRMASTMGTRRRLAVSVRSCGICTQELPQADYSAGATPAAGPDAPVQLTCKHIFHTSCIRGWTLVGKKDSCPVCMEKVDLRSVFADRPWDTRNLNWIQMLDAVRYLVVWNPLILMGLHFALHAMGMDKQAGAPAPSPTLYVDNNSTLPMLGDGGDLIANLTFR